MHRRAGWLSLLMVVVLVAGCQEKQTTDTPDEGGKEVPSKMDEARAAVKAAMEDQIISVIRIGEAVEITARPAFFGEPPEGRPDIVRQLQVGDSIDAELPQGKISYKLMEIKEEAVVFEYDAKDFMASITGTGRIEIPLTMAQ